MNSKAEQSKSDAVSAGDIAKYVLAMALVVGGLVAWWWFDGQWATPLRSLAVAAGLVLGALVFATSAKGRDTRAFLAESRFELRKVVWPTRQEAMRMTWVVVLVVIIISLFLSGVDLLIKWLIEMFLSFGRGA
ncbi:preprotein translocase subunit SecE [Pseudoxanthomonas kalamensis DSM 18571]|uniref:preprotein translocase subunit SecE n=1 Tax=Pseudoxanthomonas kalamensis TaxID=289483 RepID=UPI001391EA81|nr:preprotein translocase subunit SecE [Pseudoxanthomonas kalamensis]KAF1709453.1 preprotein translocase subunit SecE [Pseudoxanthomonas kalamensis DSM 18571]